MLPFFDWNLIKVAEFQASADTSNVTIEKFVKMFLETQMTCWFARFNIPKNLFEITMFNALEEAQELIDREELKEIPFNDISPIVMGMVTANDPMVDAQLEFFDGTPITAEKLEKAGVRSIKNVLVATLLFRELEL